MNRIEVINYFIGFFNYKKYLEIGCHNGVCFKDIKAEYKVGVEPNKNRFATHYMTSDDFFKNNKDIFDIIFIDGLHIYEQVMKDIDNALVVLDKDGIIIVHDCNPSSEIRQRVPQESGGWNGNVWKAIVDVRQRQDVDVITLDTDQGLGIIIKRNNINVLEKLDVDLLKYSDLEKNREKFLLLTDIMIGILHIKNCLDLEYRK